MRKVFYFLSLVLILFLNGFVTAQTTDGDMISSNAFMSGISEGTGTYFEVTDSEYLNVILDSSETITLRLESMPEMVTVHIEPASDATSTQITISGFEPSTTYYKYEDDYHNLVELTTDENGTYSWTQDLSQAHLVFIQPRKSTKFIKNDTSGGDCTSIGTWDAATKTCTLTTDVNETIQIDSNYITLDGNGYTVTGTGTGYGVYLYKKTGAVIKNLNVKSFDYGIYPYYSSYNTITSNTVSGTVYGIYLRSSNNNNLSSNNSSNNSYYGVYLERSSNNNLTGNILQENFWRDLYIYQNVVWEGYCNNIIQNTTGSGDKPIKYFSSSVNMEDETLSELILCNADYSNINNVTIEGSTALKNNGILIILTDYSNITNTNSSDNADGILQLFSNNITLAGNTFSNNYYGIRLYSSSNNNLTDNIIASNNGGGVYLFSENNTTLTNNTISNNGLGLYISASTNNQIYKNNFIENGGVYSWCKQACDWGKNNIFSLDKPVGGNYWSDFDASTEGCHDTDNDGFCDSPYYITNNVDYLPWTRQSDWETPADTTPLTTSITLSGTSGNNDWYVSDVQVTLNATNNEGGSGLNKTEYSLDGSTWNTYSSTITISNEGTTTVYYRSTDNADNIETQKSITISIDKTVPTVTAVTATPNTLWPPNHKMVDVTINGSASDDSSGIASTEITVTDEYGEHNMTVSFGSTIQLEAWREGTDKDGRVYTITVVVTDNAGNQSTDTTTVTVPHDMSN